MSAWFIRVADATLFNLSLLTSDVFGVAAGVFLFHERPSLLYFLAFACTIAGLVIYHKSTPVLDWSGETENKSQEGESTCSDVSRIHPKHASSSSELQAANHCGELNYGAI